MKAIISWLHPPPLTHTHPHTLSHTPALLMATCKPENSSHMQTNICHSQTHMHMYIFTQTHAHTQTHTNTPMLHPGCCALLVSVVWHCRLCKYGSPDYSHLYSPGGGMTYPALPEQGGPSLPLRSF